MRKPRPSTPNIADTARHSDPALTDRWSWVERSVWTTRMLTALEQGVKGGKRHNDGQIPSLPRMGSSRWSMPMLTIVSLFEGLTDRRAVCGKTARTVRREGRCPMTGTFPTPIVEVGPSGRRSRTMPRGAASCSILRAQSFVLNPSCSILRAQSFVLGPNGADSS